MEGKERYVWSQDFNPECPYDEYENIVDSETGRVLDNFEIKDLLNKLETNLDEEIESNCYLYDKQLETEQENQQLKQSQKQLAISELEKIYNLFEPYENSQKDTILCANNAISFLDYLDNQIKSLKGEK